VSVRAARPEDAPEVARVQAAAWRSAYGDVLPLELLTAVSGPDSMATWQAAIEHPPSRRHRLLVALEGTAVAGFASVVPASDADLDPGEDLEIQALYVLSEHAGHGHGSRLVNAIGDFAAEASVGLVTAWVSEQEAGLERLLTGAGWAADGAARRLDWRGDGQVLIRQVRLVTRIGAGS
jgi:GNAT superfamily N-acetyltransferase